LLKQYILRLRSESKTARDYLQTNNISIHLYLTDNFMLLDVGLNKSMIKQYVLQLLKTLFIGEFQI